MRMSYVYVETLERNNDRLQQLETPRMAYTRLPAQVSAKYESRNASLLPD